MKMENNPKLQALFESAANKESLDTFMQFLDMPDEQFDAVWPMYKKSFENMMKSEKFQNEQKAALTMVPGVTLDEIQAEREYYGEILYDILQEPDLSENKKQFLSILFGGMADIHEQLLASGRTQVEVKIVKLNPDAIIPTYAHATDAGADISAVEETKIEPGETKIVKTGIAVAIPAGYEIQIRPRSGLSVKTKLRIPNAPGTIDTEYRGEIGVPICNTGDVPYVIEKGMKVAQMLIAPTPMIKWDEVATVEELGTTSRGDGGFGSTDKAANAG